MPSGHLGYEDRVIRERGSNPEHHHDLRVFPADQPQDAGDSDDGTDNRREEKSQRSEHDQKDGGSQGAPGCRGHEINALYVLHANLLAVEVTALVPETREMAVVDIVD